MPKYERHTSRCERETRKKLKPCPLIKAAREAALAAVERAMAADGEPRVVQHYVEPLLLRPPLSPPGSVPAGRRPLARGRLPPLAL